MDEGDFAQVVARELLGGGWKTLGLDTGEVFVINENGDRFVLSVETVEDFYDYGLGDNDLEEGEGEGRHCDDCDFSTTDRDTTTCSECMGSVA